MSLHPLIQSRNVLHRQAHRFVFQNASGPVKLSIRSTGPPSSRHGPAVAQGGIILACPGWIQVEQTLTSGTRPRRLVCPPLSTGWNGRHLLPEPGCIVHWVLRHLAEVPCLPGHWGAPPREPLLRSSTSVSPPVTWTPPFCPCP